MRLMHKNDLWQVLFTLPWEVTYLGEQGERWLAFCLVGHTEALGEIHSATHEVRLYPGATVADRQVIALVPPK